MKAIDSNLGANTPARASNSSSRTA
ncbi:hypothetical protein Esi_0132_0071 [Ectocarpus siliculosus]|uniref:Uncharacterized protein n=1 Tax=Ectocarpus siliculosus TaxID=2880 RepID=D8LEN0_ECTSI|nr:hypothetical protein Esi_0132_0071 [Ectocarpus siliculosus]|eukprot:CBN78593.1 hypothetical protein Esi_0132_0071 [Ectocarpus siliculosus]